ncbi:E3 ubiquitin-protein ligase [Cricetulus griseus]|uniref:E3 ubiquitin-protein ligase MARCHF3 n=2 Tax=Boreoeutheria TaxID=1437010 RepID=A0A061IJZ6_CRIGR|nr:E3 ubiquitin-protein ligase [Cricetulus griseus]
MNKQQPQKDNTWILALMFKVLGFGLVISLFKVASMDCAKVLLSISEYKKTNALWINRCSHLPEVLPDCTSSAAPVVKTVEDCGSLVNGQPQYVMQVSAKDGQLLSTVVRTLATQSPFNDRPMCRICHEGSSQEDLLSPCECTGTLGTIHRSCLEHWLSSSNTSYCELCHFRFAVERKPRPLVEWLRNPGPQHEKRTLFGDMVCFLFITPLATISGWLCLRGAVDHLHFSSRLEAVGLIALTVALFTIYLFWTLPIQISSVLQPDIRIRPTAGRTPQNLDPSMCFSHPKTPQEKIWLDFPKAAGMSPQAFHTSAASLKGGVDANILFLQPSCDQSSL